MAQIPFIKMHGLGNDFIIVDTRITAFALTAEAISRLADRRRGIGCDQLVVLEHPQSQEHDCAVRFYNADGSESGACGNASRCVALLELTRTGKEEVQLETERNILRCKRDKAGLMTVYMGQPRLIWQEIPLAQEADTLYVEALSYLGYGAPAVVNVGNPHCVFFVGRLAEVPLAEIGPVVEHHALFPERTNVEFAHVVSRHEIDMRVWERGAGETLACGTGACAVAVAAFRRSYTSGQVVVHLPGGDLHISIDDNGEVLMRGAVEIAFSGIFQLEAYTA